MASIFTMIHESGLPGYLIAFVAVVASALVFERAKALFFDYSMKTDVFMSQIKSLIRADKMEEAITFCAGNVKSPIAHVVKGVLERSDRDERDMDHALDVAVSEVIPKLTKRLGYLAMIANVATLLGLFGTIEGLIMSFNAVAFADPSQKQVLLAQGISVAMYTTYLGLLVAIPVMVGFSILHAKQSRIFEEISECSGKLIEWLRDRSYVPFGEDKVFAADSVAIAPKIAAKSATPPRVPKAS